jgi:hypothetical protein
MRTAIWAILGSLCINLMLGLIITPVSVSPPVNAAELLRCPAQAAAHALQPAAHVPHAAAPAPQAPPRSGHSYIVAVRMGWA